MLPERLQLHIERLKEHRKSDTRVKHTFDSYFAELVRFLDQHQRYPHQKEDISLHNWISAQRTEYKKGLLEPEKIEQLNLVGFVWDKNEYNWNENFSNLQSYIETGDLPTYSHHKKLYSWMGTQHEQIRIGQLDEHKRKRFEQLMVDLHQAELKQERERLELVQHFKNGKVKKSMPVKIKARDVNWTGLLERLTLYREQNPRKWPQADDPDLDIRKIGIWCQVLRTRHREGNLEEQWRERLVAIGFNFDGRMDNWMLRYNDFKKHIADTGDFPRDNHSLYTWAREQSKQWNKLTNSQQQLLNASNFQDFHKPQKGWTYHYTKVAEFVKNNGKFPTRTSDWKLGSWVTSQRKEFSEGRLSKERARLLKKIKFEFRPTIKFDEIWEKMLEELKAFRAKNPNKWPSYYGSEPEKKLYVWCQAQRQANAGTLSRRKALEQYRIDGLNALGFHWTWNEFNDERWEEAFEKLQKCSNLQNPKEIPAKVSGKYNPVYTWLRAQKTAIKRGLLSAEKQQRLRSLGVL